MEKVNGITWYGELTEDSLDGIKRLSEDLATKYEVTIDNGKQLFQFLNLDYNKSLRLISTIRKYGIIVTTDDPTSGLIDENLKALKSLSKKNPNEAIPGFAELPNTSQTHSTNLMLSPEKPKLNMEYKLMTEIELSNFLLWVIKGRIQNLATDVEKVSTSAVSASQLQFDIAMLSMKLDEYNGMLSGISESSKTKERNEQLLFNRYADYLPAYREYLSKVN